jgi:hypothetical protein
MLLVDLRDLGPVGRRLTCPALAVPADPDGVRQRLEALEGLERPRARDAVVAAEQPAVDAGGFRVLEHALEGRQVPVDVVEQTEHRATVSPPCLVF